MKPIKIKIRSSTVEGREGSIYFLIIHNRIVCQLNTNYKIITSDYFVPDALIMSAASLSGHSLHHVRCRAT